MSNYYGKAPDAEKDPYDRRITQQLSDISFEEDSEDDFEDVRAIKRMPRTVLTEENLRKYLSHETTKINLEHHYWLKDSFLSKIGRMAPNLTEIILRRLQITDDSFYEIANAVTQVQKLDISDSPMIAKRGMLKFVENNGQSLVQLQASGCYDAIDDEVLEQIASVENSNLTFLDFSYCK